MHEKWPVGQPSSLPRGRRSHNSIGNLILCFASLADAKTRKRRRYSAAVKTKAWTLEQAGHGEHKMHAARRSAFGVLSELA
ncbi:hypothetical protein Pan181_09460 [Aeoliella mucimassa]|uniref:Uncharacterized protein n=1 Tax=Aeoliella mucimassa TaxID=2527972 RepID=A0A518AJ58_9BACT|nr:hypothetical protein Pan181_09460 [Aeoliella mucimassa]